MVESKLSNNQKAFITEVALEVDNRLKSAFDDIEIEIDKLRDQLPESYGEDVDQIINKVYHHAVEFTSDLRNEILNLNDGS